MLLFFFGNQVCAQELDTWFTADRAVNSPPLPSPGSLQLFTPYPPADGTSVSIWYDFVDFVEQDAIPHPAPANYPLPYPNGFDYPYPNSVYPTYLNPSGSIPGIPVLRRNSMNFNPVVRFDGSGDGQALHFDSDSRQDITVFVVFKAQGAGNSAETQRLLFGGDVDMHHVSFNQDQWLTNLSLGVSDGNRFSIGRTWFGDSGGYFQSGSIDLLTKPTIGVFQRTTGVDSERLLTHVNGTQDILTFRSETIADNDLFFFNRLGKHFNSNDSNRNLTGDIAEVLLFDGPIPPTAIQIAESYLAIKYGITLSNGPGLGSEVGNETYNYLAADGSAIWQAEATYKYDIAGIGADRYDDDPTLKLRYNLHQRISKSENPEAIVTISTNTNFSTDNLDDTRTQIDKNGLFTYLHNFLLWGSDRGSINEIFTELPVNITSRIEREWRVQINRSANVDPINNVSVRVNLFGSDILTKGDCGLKLLIDTDKDGDFTTGPITMIDATNVDVMGYVYFDGVSFEHRDVFTIGFGDTIPPTASNPNPLIVCDTAPSSDPSVVTDEDDNCAVDTVVHIGDVSDGLTNPETITRTYRITDTTGNFTDVQQIIQIYTMPDAGTDGAINICQGTILGDADLFAQLGGTPDAGGTWSPAFAGAGIYTYTVAATAPCSTDDTATVTVTEQDLNASIETIYSCNLNLPSNNILVTLDNPSIGNQVMYALDSTDLDDFILSPNFENMSSGSHSLFIMHNNGCLVEIPFEVESIEQLELTLTSEYVNQITANVTGGGAPYTYYFDNNAGSSSNIYTIDRSGTFIVRVVDDNGCETTESITMNLSNLSIPNFFTPNNDGQNDYWKPRNMELFPDIQTYIFDRYGREIKIMGPLDKGWDGYYESKPLPSGDYWYIVKLNDGSGREYVGHFTLYR